MRLNNKKILIISLISIFLISFLFLINKFFPKEKPLSAATTDNVLGWAWSENIGWISFNCYNYYNGVLENHCIEAGYSSDYGVNIESDGNITGYAWAGGGEEADGTSVSTIGWINFDPAPDFNSGLYPEDPQYSACVDLPGVSGENCDGVGDYKVSGWARACAGLDDDGDGVPDNCQGPTRTDGWDGWIKLRGYTQEATPQEYGVTISSTPNADGYYEFQGWAWGSEVVGWISFNCAEGGYDESTGNIYSVCGTSDYKVLTTFAFANQPPYVENVQLDGPIAYCKIGPGQGQVSFKWTYKDDDGDNETRFDFRVNDVNDVNDSNPEVDLSFSGLNNPDGTVNTQTAIIGTELDYNTSYYWWVKVYDSNGADSGWVQYNDPTDPDGDGDPFTFTTAFHASPYPLFSASPLNPAVDEVVEFTETSECFSSGNISYNCADGDPLIITYEWDFEPDGTIDSNATSTATTTYSSEGTYTPTLKITDSSLSPAGSCSTSTSIIVGPALPAWIEIPPF